MIPKGSGGMDELDRRLRATNLNLLPILRAVLKHRNLTRAAEELNLTQSAVSNSLRQLRAHFNDALLVRDGRQLRLTEKAKQLIEPLERALGALSDVLANPQFDPATSSRHFRVATADHVASITAPGMAAALSRTAPRITIQMLTARGRSAQDLGSGDIDMVIGPRQIVEAVVYDAPALATEFAITPLAREPFVCLAHQNDKAFAR